MRRGIVEDLHDGYARKHSTPTLLTGRHRRRVESIGQRVQARGLTLVEDHLVGFVVEEHERLEGHGRDGTPRPVLSEPCQRAVFSEPSSQRT